MLGRFGRLRREEFEVDDPRYKQLAHTVERRRTHALELARRPNISGDRGLDLGP